MFDRNFEPAGHAFVRSDAKDVRLATELTREVDVPADIAAAVDQKYVAAVAAGIGHLVGSAIVQVQEERARVELRRSCDSAEYLILLSIDIWGTMLECMLHENHLIGKRVTEKFR